MKIHKKIKIKWILIATLVLVFAFPLTASAQTVTGQMSSVFGEVLQGFAQFLAVLLKVLQRILWPIFLAIGGLLNNDILFGYGMEQRLLEVWVQIRNIVNVIFVVALLGVALFNVLAFKPDSEFALKSFLPKFAIALIAVNFSYIGMKIILDVSNVMTYAVFALPSSISKEVATPDFITCPDTGKCTINDQETVTKICTAYYGDVDKGWKDLQKELGEITDEKTKGDMLRALLCGVEGSKYTLSDSGHDFFRRYNSRNVALVMAIQFMNVTSVDTVNTTITKSSDAKTSDGKIDISGLTFQLLFAVVLYIVYGAAYVAMFVVLLTRLVALWLFIALSPLIALKVVIPDKMMPSTGGDIGEKFLKNTFAPVLMGIPLTIGYIILEAFKGISHASPGGLENALSVVRVDNAAISDLQSMIIAFAAVAVVWVGVFAAAEGTFAERATGFIKDQVGELGAKALTGLKLLPIIPAGEGGKGLSYFQAKDKSGAFGKQLMERYGPNSLGGKKVTVTQIDRLKKSKTASPEEAKKAIAGGLEGKRSQRAIYKMLNEWKGRNGRQGRFADRAIKEIGTSRMGRMKRGSLSGTEQKAIKNLRSLRTSAVATNPRKTSGTKSGIKPGTKPGATGAGGAGTGTVSQDVRTIGQAEGLGIASAGLIQQKTAHTGAFQIKDDAARIKEQKSIESGLSNNAEMKNVKLAMGASKELGAVKSRVGTLTANSKGDAVKKLKDDLKKADTAMKKKNVDGAHRKKFLGNILKNKFGADAAKITGQEGIGDLVTL